MPEPLEIVVVGDDPLANEGLSHLLSRELAGAPTITTSLEDDALERADAVVWDLGASPPEELGPPSDAPTVVLVTTKAVARRALAAGARGVLFRSASGRTLARALEAAAAGLIVVDDELSEIVVRREPGREPLAEPLTPRELEVLQQLALGQSNKAIADSLNVSLHTAKFHVNSLMGKLGATTRTEIVAIAARSGLITF